MDHEHCLYLLYNSQRIQNNIIRKNNSNDDTRRITIQESWLGLAS